MPHRWQTRKKFKCTETSPGHYVSCTSVVSLPMPCCTPRDIRLKVTPGVASETYVRQCASCGSEWTVERVTVSDYPGMRTDKVSWRKS